jgi:hypothetical protein
MQNAYPPRAGSSTGHSEQGVPNPRAPRGIRACLGLLAVVATLAAWGCGGSALSRGGESATITDTAAVGLSGASISMSCPEAVLGAIEEVAHQVYQESASGRIVAEATQRLRSSSALAQAVEHDDRVAARRALKKLLLNQIVSVRVTRAGHTLAKIERGTGIAPASGPLLNALRQPVGAFTVSVQGANGYAQTISGLLHAEVVIRSAGRQLTATLHPAPRLARGEKEVSYQGVSYRVGAFTGEVFPDQPLSISLLVPATAVAMVCERHGSSTPSTAQAQASTLGLVAERVYDAERVGSKAELILHYAEHSRPFREAVLAGNRKATWAAIIGFFRSHLHIVRVRVIRAGKLFIDVGGPHVLAPIPGVIRGASGRVAAHFLLAIQDDMGFQLLAHAFTGAQVLMREGARQVMGTLSPGPATIPNRGRADYRGVAYQVYSFNAEAFPSGPLRISLLFPTG